MRKKISSVKILDFTTLSNFTRLNIKLSLSDKELDLRFCKLGRVDLLVYSTERVEILKSKRFVNQVYYDEALNEGLIYLYNISGGSLIK